MQRLNLLIVLALGSVALAVAPVAKAQSVDPCSVYTCMAGISGVGASGGAACEPSTNLFFESLVVYDEEGFDAPATAALRYSYLMTCPGSQYATNAVILAGIVNVWYDTP